MIIVVEGASASGKSTWCARYAADCTIPESAPSPDAPDRRAQPREGAAYWLARSAERWAAALALEASNGVSVCDTDPLKLHYAWSLFVLGEIDTTAFSYERDATRAAIAAGRLGFADLVSSTKSRQSRSAAAATWTPPASAGISTSMCASSNRSNTGTRRSPN